MAHLEDFNHVFKDPRVIRLGRIMKRSGAITVAALVQAEERLDLEDSSMGTGVAPRVAVHGHVGVSLVNSDLALRPLHITFIH